MSIEGVSGEILTNVKALLGIEQQRRDETLTTARIQRLHRKAEEEIRAALQPYGYYQPRVDSELVFRGGMWQARYRIRVGEPVKVARFDITLLGPGATDPIFLQAQRAITLREGDVLRHDYYEAAKALLQNTALENGYLDAQVVESEGRVLPGELRAELRIIFATGLRYTFGEIVFTQSGEHRFDPAFLQRLTKDVLTPGTPYTTLQLLELQAALRNTDHFANVTVQAPQSAAVAQVVPVQVALSARPKHRYTIGLGYGTDTGPRTKLGWENRHITDTGNSLKFETKISEVKNSATVRYTLPIRNPRFDKVEFTTGWVSEKVSVDNESETTILGVSRTVRLSERWFHTLYVNYQTESFIAGSNTGLSRLLLPGTSVSYTRADNRLYTRHGLRLLLDVRGAHTALLSDSDFLQLRGQGKLITSLGDRGRIILRGEFGLSYIDDFATLPTSLRFYAGGDESVRGYSYHSLSDTDSEGKPVGSEQLLVGSAEYEHRIGEKWGVATFYDVGNAINDWTQALKHGAGIGLRWRSPVGLIRVDVAWPVGDPANKNPQLHLVVGPDL